MRLCIVEFGLLSDVLLIMKKNIAHDLIVSFVWDGTLKYSLYTQTGGFHRKPRNTVNIECNMAQLALKKFRY